MRRLMRSRQKQLGPQPWPWLGSPRVLIEDPEEAESLESVEALRRAGYAVAVCPGPIEASPGVCYRCPLVAQEECALVDGADVVVSSLGLDRPEDREVLETLKLRRPSKRLIVKASRYELERWPDLVEGCTVLVSPATPDELVAAVSDALASTPA